MVIEQSTKNVFDEDAFLKSSPKDLEAMLGGADVKSDPEPKEAEDDDDAAELPEEIVKDVVGDKPAPETQQEKTEPEYEPGVKKRIAQENERAQRAINEAISRRKAAEAELAKTASNPGAEPEKSPKPATNARPVKPDIETFEGTNAEFKAANDKFELDLETWLKTSTRETVQAELAAERAADEAKRERDGAITKHGAEFPARSQVVAEGSSEGLQYAISGLEDWSGVVNHLGQNPNELAELNQLFESNPARAVARLGKLEDRIAAVNEKPAPVREKRLPEPIVPQGGNSSTGGRVNLETADFQTSKRELARMLK